MESHLTGEIKFGTADEEKGLGTGESDYSVQADAFRFFDRFTAIGSVGYLFRGDPADIDLEDVFFASAGGSYVVSSQTRLGFFYDYQKASVSGNDAMQELSATFSSRPGENWWMTGYVSAGFSDSSPDWGLASPSRQASDARQNDFDLAGEDGDGRIGA